MKVETTAYIVLEPERDYRGKLEAIKVDRITKMPPDLKSRQVALKLNIGIDSAIFEQFIPEATLTIRDGRTLITPDVSIETPDDEDGTGATEALRAAGHLPEANEA